MGKTELLASAELLRQPSEKTATEFEAKREILGAEMNRIMLARPDLVALVGEGNQQMMEDNHRNHLRFFSSVFQDYHPSVLVETVLWVYRAYRHHGFNLTYWPAQLDQWVFIFREHLSAEAFNEIYPFYHWMIINQPVFVAESDNYIMTGEIPGH